MGNTEAKPKEENEDSLRDYSVGVTIPASVAKPNSNLLLAFSEGNYYPCVILDRAKKVPNGYLVFFFHNQTELEIPSTNVIGNFRALLDCKVSFTINGINYTGKVVDMASNDKHEITNFFISAGDQCAWVSLPFIFLSIGQARLLS